MYSTEDEDCTFILAEDNRVAFRLPLSDALSNMASELRQLRRYTEALEYDTENMKLARVLARNEHGTNASQLRLSDALSHIAFHLRQLGRPEMALEYETQNVRLARGLTKYGSNAFELCDALSYAASDISELLLKRTLRMVYNINSTF